MHSGIVVGHSGPKLGRLTCGYRRELRTDGHGDKQSRLRSATDRDIKQASDTGETKKLSKDLQCSQISNSLQEICQQ